jgi:hypothetical protein
MKTFIKALAATAVLAMGSVGAMAQTVPTQPAPGPIPSPGSGDGGLVVVIWDAVRGVSLTQYLGLSLSQILPTGTNMEQAGFSLDFGVLGNYASIFGASAQSNIQWMVVAADSTGSTFSGRNIATTSALGSTYTTTSNARTRDAASAVRNFLENTNGCALQTPCIATANDQGTYAGGTNMGSNLGSQLLQSSAGTVGQALGFYLLTTINNLSVGPTAVAVVDVYQSTAGAFAQWLLGTDGRLVYSVAGDTVVPLPAAVWLLLSGLLGVGTIGRRRAVAAA